MDLDKDSSLTVLKNGDIGLFFEIDEYKDNTFVRFSFPWLNDNKDSYKKPAIKNKELSILRKLKLRMGNLHTYEQFIN